MAKNIRIEGPFSGCGGRFPDYLNKCGSCRKEIKGDKEYRRTWNEELFEKTGGREGRTYYCVPCGERISVEETTQEKREREKYNNEKEQNAQKVIKDCSQTITHLEQK